MKFSVAFSSCVRAIALATIAAVSAQAQPVLAGFSTSVALDDEGAWVYLFVDGSAGSRSVLISAAGPGYASQTTARVVSDPQIEVFDPSGNRVAFNDVLSNNPGRLTNLSVRAFAGTGDRILIVGFTLSGPGTKPVLIRSVGPGLAALNLSGTIPDPRLGVFLGPNEITSNDNWTIDDGRALGAFCLRISAHRRQQGCGIERAARAG